MEISSEKRNKILLAILIMGISIPILIIFAMALFVYPNNDSLVNFIIKYRYLLGLY